MNSNQKNLALKGMIGIRAMAVIAKLTDNTADGVNYTNIAHDYIKQWQTLGIAHDANPPHATLSYGANETHGRHSRPFSASGSVAMADHSSIGLLYNLYGDRLLSLDLAPQSVYDMQSNFYATVAEQYGVPLDSRHDYTKNDWQLLCAAVTSANTTSLHWGHRQVDQRNANKSSLDRSLQCHRRRLSQRQSNFHCSSGRWSFFRLAGFA